MTEVNPYVPAYGEVDLTNCDREPIHVPGAVQPHGFLLAVDRATRTVVVASQSAATYLGRGAEELLGTPLADVLGPALAGEVLAVDASEALSEDRKSVV